MTNIKFHRHANASVAPATLPKATPTGLATQKQIDWIKSLVALKHTTSPSLEGMTQKQASEAIATLSALPNYREASEAQIRRITGRCKDMGLAVPDMSKLSMKKASIWIETLDKKFTEEFANKVTEKQISMLKRMSMCPEIDNSELFAIPDELLQQLDGAQLEVQVAMNLQDQVALKVADAKEKEVLTTINGFAQAFEIEKITKQVASDFIGKNQQVYYRWMATRLSDAQKEMITTFLERMGNPPLSEEALMQFDYETADQYLIQLQKEMADANLRGFGDKAQEEGMGMPDSYNKKQIASLTRRDVTQVAWEAVIHALYATVGQQAEFDILTSTFSEKALDEVVAMVLDTGETKATIAQILLTIMDEDEANEYVNSFSLAEVANDASAESDLPAEWVGKM